MVQVRIPALENMRCTSLCSAGNLWHPVQGASTPGSWPAPKSLPSLGASATTFCGKMRHGRSASSPVALSRAGANDQHNLLKAQMVWILAAREALNLRFLVSTSVTGNSDDRKPTETERVLGKQKTWPIFTRKARTLLIKLFDYRVSLYPLIL